MDVEKLKKMDGTVLPKAMISAEQVQKRILELAEQINQDYQGKPIMAICILKGATLFFSDIIRHLKMPVRCEFMGISSYGNEKRSSGEVKVTLDTKYPIEGEHVIIFEDIVDSGLTLTYLNNLLGSRRPASIKICSLLFKPCNLKTKLHVDYAGFEIGDCFVLGYGLDYMGLYRNLPYVGIFE